MFSLCFAIFDTFIFIDRCACGVRFINSTANEGLLKPPLVSQECPYGRGQGFMLRAFSGTGDRRGIGSALWVRKPAVMPDRGRFRLSSQRQRETKAPSVATHSLSMTPFRLLLNGPLSILKMRPNPAARQNSSSSFYPWILTTTKTLQGYGKNLLYVCFSLFPPRASK